MAKIAILGGTGFVGGHLASRLAKEKHSIRLITRQREAHRDCLVLPNTEVISANVYQQNELNAAVQGCDAVVHLVGILNENGNNGEGFKKAHVELTDKLIEACKANNIKHVLFMSALNADMPNPPSFYLKSKAEALRKIHGSGLNVTSFKPSVIFGEDDSFFNRFAQLLGLMPFIFPLACPNSRLAPVWIDDVVTAMAKTLLNKAHYGKSYSLCGPKVYTLQQIVETTARMMGVKRRIIALSNSMSLKQAQFMDKLPVKLFSTDNYKSLQIDSVCRENDFAELGIEPHSVEAIMPRYFAQPTPRAAYHKYRTFANRD